MVAAVCLLTALLAGLTVWSMDGTITTTTQHTNGHSNWYETNTHQVDPAVQGTLAFLTACMLLFSMASINSRPYQEKLLRDLSN